MTSDSSPQPISPLRSRMIEDMSVRGFQDDTRRDYVRHVRAFTRSRPSSASPDTAAPERRELVRHLGQALWWTVCEAADTSLGV
jgi:hypothetical protein